MNIVDIGRSYLNKKEKPNNSGFEDPAFEMEMISEGWQKGWAWCAVFAKLVAKKAYPEKTKEYNKLFTPGAVQTFTNFKAAGYPVSSTPEAGDLVIWQHYANGVGQWQGHAGIVTEVIDGNNFKSIEGNTSSTGSRNGDRVFEQKRSTNKKENGLNVMGFIKLN